MVFSSTVFLFLFLPIVFFLNFLLKPAYRNFFLLIVSLFFYAWGEGIVVLLMIFSSCINYLGGLAITYYRAKPHIVKYILGVAISINLLFLFYYKYLNFVVANLPSLFPSSLAENSIILPIGISFYTFHGISYLVDIHRKNIPALKNPIDLGLYIAFFPQLIAGPIVRYSDIAEQLKKRNVNLDDVYQGVVRFIRGLFKKIVIANTMGQFVDTSYQQPINDLPTLISWFCIICYALQIYFDFSGYSDMAIGMARMFGFHFKENFDHPYAARSIQDFWRRWHISLSSWFRDYVYIPLGGNQKGLKRTYANLFIVFLITGLWHGAGWNFIVWGLFHGLFLILERSKVINLDKLPSFVGHVYTIVVVLIAWVFFRLDTLPGAIDYLKSMVGITNGENYAAYLYINPYFITVFLMGLLLCVPVREWTNNFFNTRFHYPRLQMLAVSMNTCMMFAFAIVELAQSSYNPFIYFRF